ncbi:beta-ketoacyl-ACP synthase III [Elstera cyanobacteriorum]|uniref:Beta-ketoacyl-[acyl-carrier-protein] synthase III n=1 Tax=Elstera cyanobacteriorum TaxID=2022747 RepID=A0A255XQQ7_9PROT|nr:beta-ketoacyl-ACP synthase III [Elstera cyanobacteriorum]MCK6442140.1 ketoacyl-ACP synthase III [Elstera cyanobacteriorum]OYQ18775.1 3-oxoacyl-ACP synthase [Elstera cyanobacteriorum]GFZ77783.1 3-oxoacyl-[acyl-carrier-protein] synthase 3 [Elstera cyanobacteriorum]
MSFWRSRIIGTGSYLPARIVTNDELAQRVDTSDEWIQQRSGIRQRHVAAEGETTADLAEAAARQALEAAGVAASELDLIILATTTPDDTFPSTATKVQARLGMVRGAAFDVQAVCSGFVYALAVADNFIKAGQAKTILVIGAETFTRILDWEDRTTCVLFGDGAGAVVLRAEAGTGSVDDHGILSTHLHSDGRERDILYVDGGPSSTRTVGHVRMLGKEVFRHAVTNLAAVVTEALEANGLTPAAIDWLVPHQANRRILDATAKKLALPVDRVVVTLDRHANTSAASVPLALDEAVRDGRIKPGHLILVEAMGGGLTWGSALIRM